MIEPVLFPYLSFPIRLEYGDRKESAVCWFECEEHLQRYLNRYKLDKRKLKINYRDEQPTKSSKTNTKKLQSTTEKNSDRSGGRNRGSTKNLDTNRTSNRTRKSK